MLELDYKNPLCFDASQEVRIKANWFSTDYHLPTIGISYCTPGRGKTCKRKDETDEWLRSHPAFFVH